MNIVYASNENYAPHLAVSMYSLFDNNTSVEDITVYIIDTGISKSSKDKLNLIGRSFERTVIYLDFNDIESKAGDDIDTGRFDISAMARLWVGELIPSDVHRVLYIDCDTVVPGDIRGLFDKDLKDCVMGAALEPTIYKDVKRYLNMNADDPYYNSGVLLIDLDIWRREDIGKGILDYYRSINDKSLFCDQDAINGYLNTRIATISPAYNFFTNYKYYKYDVLTGIAPWFKRIPRKVYNHAVMHPRIVHFAGDERPWKMFNQNPYRALYDIYLELTPFNTEKKEKANIIYMTMYHMMNVLTLISPGSRKKISEIYAGYMKEERTRSEHIDEDSMHSVKLQ